MLSAQGYEKLQSKAESGVKWCMCCDYSQDVVPNLQMAPSEWPFTLEMSIQVQSAERPQVWNWLYSDISQVNPRICEAYLWHRNSSEGTESRPQIELLAKMIPFLSAFPPQKSLNGLCPISNPNLPKPFSLFLYSLPHCITNPRTLSSPNLQLSTQTHSYNSSFCQLIFPPLYINIKTSECKSDILTPLLSPPQSPRWLPWSA